jgi:hypothetical protein
MNAWRAPQRIIAAHPPDEQDAVDQRRWFEAVGPIFQLFIATDSGTLWSDLLWYTADGQKSFAYLLRR